MTMHYFVKILDLDGRLSTSNGLLSVYKFFFTGVRSEFNHSEENRTKLMIRLPTSSTGQDHGFFFNATKMFTG